MPDTLQATELTDQAASAAHDGCPAVADLYPWLDPAETARRLAGQRVAPVVVPTGERMWLVCGHAEALQAMADPALSRAAAAKRSVAATPAQLARRGGQARDSETHLALRRALAPAFTARQARTMSPWLERTAHRMVGDLFSAPPHADVVAGLARPLPMAAVSKLLGLDPRLLPRIAADADISATERASTHEIAAALARITSQVIELIDQRRKEPQNTLLDRLITISDDGDLPDTHLAGLVRDLVIVGWHEAARRIATGIHALLSHPDQYRLLRSDPSLVAQAVQELLRHEKYPSDLAPRVATGDTTIVGTRIPADDTVVVSSYAADHDPLVHPDPDRLDITRPTGPLLAFGHGIHYCPGSHLARTILAATLTALCRHPPLTPAGTPQWRHGWVAPSLHTLPVARE
ncbi:cytochrome P450 [Streptomyces rectiverticillatus]|uniref:cytochrome P450 n=1 Tax=Streptomyces rectiverticillatus TaxID=173860 RepID=UPI0015C3A9A4|nr:cytochrome P450 [Streptomyces rectiverticillatus]QLE74600.1 cytochrome P450 [Streptomyces rectiverticillatus]